MFFLRIVVILALYCSNIAGDIASIHPDGISSVSSQISSSDSSLPLISTRLPSPPADRRHREALFLSALNVGRAALREWYSMELGLRRMSSGLSLFSRLVRHRLHFEEAMEQTQQQQHSFAEEWAYILESWGKPELRKVARPPLRLTERERFGELDCLQSETEFYAHLGRSRGLFDVSRRLERDTGGNLKGDSSSSSSSSSASASKSGAAKPGAAAEEESVDDASRQGGGGGRAHLAALGAVIDMLSVCNLRGIGLIERPDGTASRKWSLLSSFVAVPMLRFTFNATLLEFLTSKVGVSVPPHTAKGAADAAMLQEARRAIALRLSTTASFEWSSRSFGMGGRESQSAVCLWNATQENGVGISSSALDASSSSSSSSSSSWWWEGDDDDDDAVDESKGRWGRNRGSWIQSIVSPFLSIINGIFSSPHSAQDFIKSEAGVAASSPSSLRLADDGVLQFLSSIQHPTDPDLPPFVGRRCLESLAIQEEADIALDYSRILAIVMPLGRGEPPVFLSSKGESGKGAESSSGSGNMHPNSAGMLNPAISTVADASSNARSFGGKGGFSLSWFLNAPSYLADEVNAIALIGTVRVVGILLSPLRLVFELVMTLVRVAAWILEYAFTILSALVSPVIGEERVDEEEGFSNFLYYLPPLPPLNSSLSQSLWKSLGSRIWLGISSVYQSACPPVAQVIAPSSPSPSSSSYSLCDASDLAISRTSMWIHDILYPDFLDPIWRSFERGRASFLLDVFWDGGPYLLRYLQLLPAWVHPYDPEGKLLLRRAEVSLLAAINQRIDAALFELSAARAEMATVLNSIRAVSRSGKAAQQLIDNPNCDQRSRLPAPSPPPTSLLAPSREARFPPLLGVEPPPPPPSPKTGGGSEAKRTKKDIPTSSPPEDSVEANSFAPVVPFSRADLLASILLDLVGSGRGVERRLSIPLQEIIEHSQSKKSGTPEQQSHPSQCPPSSSLQLTVSSSLEFRWGCLDIATTEVVDINGQHPQTMKIRKLAMLPCSILIVGDKDVSGSVPKLQSAPPLETASREEQHMAQSYGDESAPQIFPVMAALVFEKNLHDTSAFVRLQRGRIMRKGNLPETLEQQERDIHNSRSTASLPVNPLVQVLCLPLSCNSPIEFDGNATDERKPFVATRSPIIQAHFADEYGCTHLLAGFQSNAACSTL